MSLPVFYVSHPYLTKRLYEEPPSAYLLVFPNSGTDSETVEGVKNLSTAADEIVQRLRPLLSILAATEALFCILGTTNGSLIINKLWFCAP